ncbi:MAG: TrmH family RNA methyltransferase [Chitinophagaceae bacterium]
MTPERRERLLQVLKNRQPNLTILLENVFDPHNISAVMRTCDAVGIQEIFVLNTRNSNSPKWGIKSSSSASKWLTIHQFDDIQTCINQLKTNYGRILTTYLGPDSTSLYQINFTEPVALVFGNEHDGVSETIRKLADGDFVIPQYGMIRSLNISVACAVCLYEAFRQKSEAGHYLEKKIIPFRYRHLLDQWGLDFK